MRAITLCAVAACLVALALADPTGDDRKQTTPEVSDVDAAEHEDFEREIKTMEVLKQMTYCCRATKMVLSVFPLGGITCTGQLLWDKLYSYYTNMKSPEKITPTLRDGCVVECIYRANNFLTDKKEIKEKVLREKIMEHIKGKSKGFFARINKFITTANTVFAKNKGNVSELVESYTPAIESCFEMIHEQRDMIESLDEGKRGDGKKCKQSPQMLLSCLALKVTMNCPTSYWKEEKKECAGKQQELRRKFEDLIQGDTKKHGLRNHAELPNEGVEANNNGE